MVRWEPDAAGRLAAAAMELYVERGFEQTTVADIADRAGLTARTFFRYFNDKREVLFAGADVLRAGLVNALDEAPPTATALESVWAALEAAAAILGRDHNRSRLRQTVISANTELHERELIKMATIATDLAAGLRRRGFGEVEAMLAAEVGVSVLRVSFERWVAGSGSRKLSTIMRNSFEQLKSLAVAG